MENGRGDYDSAERTAERRADRDLLVRIEEQVKQLRIDFSADRIAVNERSKEYERNLEKVRIDVDALRTWRAQLYAVQATITVVISLLFRVFWK
jgi:hypothetical protein